MKHISLVLIALFFIQCSSSKKPTSGNSEPTPATSMSLEIGQIFSLEGVSTRALQWMPDQQRLYFSGTDGHWGFLDEKTNQITVKQLSDKDAKALDFRGISSNSNLNVFILSAGSPGLIYKIDTETNQTTLVYKEEGEGVFYDALKFSDFTSGVAFGDALNGCMSVLLTTNGGNTWTKVACDKLPAAQAGEGAFAASNSNIAISGSQVLLAAKNYVLSSPDYGLTWKKINTPIINSTESQGIYSIDFFDDQLGVAIGGDYSKPELATNNLIKTTDGGNTWSLLKGANAPSYRSCIKFLPRSNGLGLIAVGFEGINGSVDQGNNWISLSNEEFYTLTFTSPTTGYLAGKNKMAKFSLKFDH